MRLVAALLVFVVTARSAASEPLEPRITIYAEASLATGVLVGTRRVVKTRGAVGTLVDVRESLGFERFNEEGGSLRVGAVVHAFEATDSNVGGGFEAAVSWVASRCLRYRIRAAYTWTGGHVVRNGGDASFFTIGLRGEGRYGGLGIDAIRASAPKVDLYGLMVVATAPRRPSMIVVGASTTLAVVVLGVLLISHRHDE